MFSDKNPILGQQDKRYKLDTHWSQADPARNPVNDCHEMVQDSKGRILMLTNEVKNNVLIYDKNGRLLEAWGTDYPGGHGLTLFNENGADVLFIADTVRHQVIKTTAAGKVLMVIDYPREADIYLSPEEFVPTETAIAANGDIYVADGYGKDYIIRYDRSGRYIGHFGGKGDRPECLSNAHGICIDLRDAERATLIATSRAENAFKRYTLDGEYISTVNLPGAWVCRAVINGDFLYSAVLESDSAPGKKSGFVTILNRDFKVVSNLGGVAPVYSGNRLEEMYQTEKYFSCPHDVCVDDEQNIYVAQWNSEKVYPYKLSPIA